MKNLGFRDWMIILIFGGFAVFLLLLAINTEIGILFGVAAVVAYFAMVIGLSGSQKRG